MRCSTALRKPARPRGWLQGSAVVVLLACVPGVAQDAGTSLRIREVRIETHNVFPSEEAAGNLLFALANMLHRPTREHVVRTELWFGPGDVADAERIEELERNLRAMDLFAEVEAAVERASCATPTRSSSAPGTVST